MDKFKELFKSKDISKEVQKRLKKGSVMLINPDEILVSFDDYDDGVFVGMDQFDNDVEEESLKGYRFDESNLLEGKVAGTVDRFKSAVEKELKKQGYNSLSEVKDVNSFMKKLNFKMSQTEFADVIDAV